MNKIDLIKYLDEYLKINEFQDGSKNGLQVDNDRTDIKKIGYAVDATSYILDKAIKEKVDLLIVHHGLFWTFQGSIPLVSYHYERISKLVKNNIGLYGAHLPLDAHEEVGNNIGIIKSFTDFFDLKDYNIEKFGEYQGETIGFGIRFKEKINIEKIKDFCQREGFVFEFYNFGNLSEFTSFCVLSGGGGSDIDQAKDKGYHIFLTGEAAHHEIINGKDMKQSIILGGHYETETVGVKLLAKHLKEKFNLEVVFLDEKY